MILVRILLGVESNDHVKLADPGEILEEEERFFKQIYTRKRESERFLYQQQGIISLIPKKNKNAEYLTNWRPVSLLNVDYKIATKTIALRLEKILPSVIHPCQSGYGKGRFIGESIRLIADTIDSLKLKIYQYSCFLRFRKAFDSVEWDFIQICLESFNCGPNLRQWISVFYKDIPNNNLLLGSLHSLYSGFQKGPN